MERRTEEVTRMALYEYRCSECVNEFEERRPMSEAGAPAKCPQCNADALRLPSVFASKDGYNLRLPKGEAFRGGAPRSGASN